MLPKQYTVGELDELKKEWVETLPRYRIHLLSQEEMGNKAIADFLQWLTEREIKNVTETAKS